MSYRNYKVEDFLLDEYFIQWVTSPDPETIFFWDKWLSQNPDKKDSVYEATAIIRSAHFKNVGIPDSEKSELWSRIKETTRSSEPVERDIRPTFQKHRAKKRPVNRYVAASVVALVLMAVAFFSIQDLSSSRKTEETIADTDIIRQNPVGQKSNILLPDGSKIKLNSASSIRYVKDFTARERVVYLKGEAFFDVAKDSLRPFKVYAFNTTTQAYGTSFNIKAFHEDGSVEVSLLTGKVGVETEDQSLQTLLIPGEGVSYNRVTRSSRKLKFDLNKVISWKEGIIYFEDTPFDEAVKTLERWYGVTIVSSRVSDQNVTCSGTFNNRSLTAVLESLGFSLGFTFKITNDHVKLHFTS